MNKKTMSVVLLAFSLGSLAGVTSAEPNPINLNFCTKLSGSIASGQVAAHQQQVIYGPYTVKCGTTNHHFNVRGSSGQIPVIVQQLRGGSWSAVIEETYEPRGPFGAGTFRLVLDNRQGQTSVSYTGSYTVPM